MEIILCSHEAVLDEDGFVSSYYKLIDNLHTLLNKDLENVFMDVFIKNKDNTVGKRFSNIQKSEIDGLIDIIYNRDKLKEYIES